MPHMAQAFARYRFTWRILASDAARNGAVLVSSIVRNHPQVSGPRTRTRTSARKRRTGGRFHIRSYFVAFALRSLMPTGYFDRMRRISDREYTLVPRLS